MSDGTQLATGLFIILLTWLYVLWISPKIGITLACGLYSVYVAHEEDYRCKRRTVHDDFERETEKKLPRAYKLKNWTQWTSDIHYDYSQNFGPFS